MSTSKIFITKIFCIFLLGALNITNSNSQWSTVSSGTIENLETIHFFDELNGICSGRTANLLTTVDGGESWIIIETIGFSDFDFFNDSIGYGAAGSAASLGITNNAASTWNYNFPGPILNALFGVSATSASTAYFGGTGGLIWKTTDSANSANILDSGTTEFITDVVFVDSLIGFISTKGGEIKKSEDAGLTWNTAYLNSEVVLTNIIFLNKNLGFVVGFNGKILKSTDGGNIWVELNSDSEIDLEGIDFFDTENGIAVGGDGGILITNDGGLNWIPQNSGISDKLTDVEMLSKNKAIIVGDNGTVLKNDLINDLIVVPVRKEVYVYPNPVKNDLMVTGLGNRSNIKVFSISGRLMQEVSVMELDEYKIKFDKFPHGVYVIIVENEYGIFPNKVLR